MNALQVPAHAEFKTDDELFPTLRHLGLSDWVVTFTSETITSIAFANAHDREKAIEAIGQI